MIPCATHGMGNSVHVPDSTSQILVHAKAVGGWQPQFTVFGAEDQMIMQRNVRERHGETSRAPAGAPNIILCGGGPVVPLVPRCTTGYQPRPSGSRRRHATSKCLTTSACKGSTAP